MSAGDHPHLALLLSELSRVPDADGDVGPETNQHGGKPVRGEFLEVIRHQPGHLGCSVLHNKASLGACQVEAIDLTLELSAEELARDRILFQWVHALSGLFSGPSWCLSRHAASLDEMEGEDIWEVAGI